MRDFGRRSVRWAMVGIVAMSMFGYMIGRGSVPAAQEEKPGGKAQGSEAPQRPLKLSDIPPETYVVPARADVKGLLKFIAKIDALRPDIESETDAVKFLTVSRGAIVTAADKILQSRPTEEQEIEALQSKLQAYQIMLMVGVPEVGVKGLKFAEQLKADKRPMIAELGESAWLDFKTSMVPTLDVKERRAIVDAIAVALRKKPQSFFKFAQNLGRMLEALGDGENAAAAYSSFGEVLSQNLDEKIRAIGERMKTGAVRRARLLSGDPVKVSGKTIDGRPFDLSEYKGKVVVVDFWATWCGPCLAELPNLKSVYQKYHNRGLEVVGISLDDDQEELTKFLKDNDLPWKILHSTAKDQKGFADPNADMYGIDGIPTVLLINRSGKVISLNARGEQLATLVDGLLGGPGPVRK